MTETIDHPPHYAGARWEAIDVIDKLGNQFRLGNALKYLARQARKNGIEDVRKALWYVEREAASEPAGPSKPSVFDEAFFREHVEGVGPSALAENFGISDPDLSWALHAVALACGRAFEQDFAGWRHCVGWASQLLHSYIRKNGAPRD